MGDIQAVQHVDQVMEAETLLAHLPVYLEVKFGSAIWKWFSSDCRIEMEDYVWDEDQQRVIETDVEEGPSDFLLGFHGEQMADWEKVDEEDIDEPENDVKFELDIFFNFAPRLGGHGFDDGFSMASHLTGVSQATQLANEPSTATHLS